MALLVDAALVGAPASPQPLHSCAQSAVRSSSFGYDLPDSLAITEVVSRFFEVSAGDVLPDDLELTQRRQNGR